MIGLILVPLLVLLLAVTALSWARNRRRDERSIQAHRSALGVIEHVAGADVPPLPGHERTTAHVRIVGQPPGRAPRPARQAEAELWPPRPRSRRPSFPRPRETWLQPPQVPAPAVPPATSAARPAASAARPAAPAVPPAAAPSRPAAMNREIARLLAARIRTARSSLTAPPKGAQPVEATPAVDLAPAPSSAPATPAASSAPTGAPAGLSRRPRLRGHAVPAGPHLPVVLASAAVVLVMAAITGIALNLHHGASRPRPSAAVHRPAVTAPPPPPASTTPPPPTVVATGASSAYATYTVDATNLDVNLVAAHSCWVELREGTPSGPVLFEGTLTSGVSQVFHAVGAIWLRLGNPSGVKLTIDGSPLGLPAAANPFDVTVTGPAGT